MSENAAPRQQQLTQPTKQPVRLAMRRSVVRGRDATTRAEVRAAHDAGGEVVHRHQQFFVRQDLIILYVERLQCAYHALHFGISARSEYRSTQIVVDGAMH